MRVKEMRVEPRRLGTWGRAEYTASVIEVSVYPDVAAQMEVAPSWG